MSKPAPQSGMTWPAKTLEIRNAAPSFEKLYFNDRHGWLDARHRRFRPVPWDAEGGKGAVVIATWDFQAQNGPFYGNSTGPATLYVLPVPADLRAAIHKACMSTGLPMLEKWLQDGHAKGDGWTLTPHRAEWHWPSTLVTDPQ